INAPRSEPAARARSISPSYVDGGTSAARSIEKRAEQHPPPGSLERGGEVPERQSVCGDSAECGDLGLLGEVVVRRIDEGLLSAGAEAQVHVGVAVACFEVLRVVIVVGARVVPRAVREHLGAPAGTNAAAAQHLGELTKGLRTKKLRRAVQHRARAHRL